MKTARRTATIVGAAVVGVVAYSEPAHPASVTWTGAVVDPASSGFTVTTLGMTADLVDGQPVYNWNTSDLNFSGSGGATAYGVGDDVAFTDAVGGSTVIRATSSNLNPNSMTFIHDGSGTFTTYTILRTNMFDGVSGNTPFGSGHATVLTLDTGFNGKVIILPRATGSSNGIAETIVRSGILQYGDGGALPNRGSNNQPLLTLAGGQYWMDVRPSNNTQPASSQQTATMTISADSVLANAAPNNGRVWGNNGTIDVNAGVTLTIKSIQGFQTSLGSRLAGTGTILLEDQNTGAGTLTTLNASNNFRSTDVAFDLGVGSSTLLANLNMDMGALFGGVNTTLTPGSGNTVSIGGKNIDSTFNGVITQGSIAKVGSGRLVLTNNNAYAGTTAVSAGTLEYSGANGAAASTTGVNIGNSGVLRLDNTSNNNNRLADGAAITLNVGKLEFVGNLTAQTNEVAGQLNVTGGSNNVAALATGAGGPATITFAALNRTGGIINFDQAAGVNVSFTAAPTITNGIIGGFATADSSNWATVSGNTIAAYTHSFGETDTAPATWTNTQNINLIAGGTSTVTAATSIYSLRVASGVDVAINGGAGLTVESGGILAPGTSNPTISGAGSLTAGTGSAAADVLVQIPNAANTLTINAPIADNTASGTVTLIKAGAGKLVLGGTNTFTGGLTIGGGTVATGANNVFTAGTLTVDFGNTFDIGGFNQTFDGVILIDGTLDNTSGPATLSSGTFDLRNGTVNASLGGSGGLNKSTGSTVTLNAVNSFVGGTTVTNGTLMPTVAGALPSTGSVLVSGGELNIGATNQSIATLTVSGGSVTGTSGVITGSFYDIQGGTTSATLGGSGVELHKNNSTNATVSGNNAYTGATRVNQGTLSIASLHDGSLASSIGQSGSAATNLVFQGGGTLTYVGPDTSTDRLFTLNGDAAIFTTGSGTMNWSNSGAIAGSGILTLGGGNSGTNIFTPSISGNVGLAKVSGGYWALGQSNTFSNELRAHNGTLDIQSFNQTTGNFVLGSDSNPPGVSNGNLVGTGILTTTNTDLKAGTVSVVIAGTTDLNKNGLGTQTVNLMAANTNTGVVNVNAGTLAVSIIADGGIASGLGTSPADADRLRINGNGTLAYIGTGGSTNRLFQLNGDGGLASSGTGSVQWTNTGALNSGPELRLSGTNTLNNSFAPQITGGSRLLKANAGQWLVTNTNTYTGTTTIAGGTLTIAAIADGGVNSPIGASTNDAANLVIGGGGALKYTGNGSTDRRFTIGLTNPAAAAGNAIIDASGTGPLTFTNPGQIDAGAGTGARVLTLTGNNTFNNSIAGIMIDANTGAGSITGVTKTGTNRWILSGANTYTGATIVNGGSLQLNLAAHGPVLNPVGAATTAFANVQAGNLVFDYNGGSTVAPTVLSTLTAGYALADKFSAGAIRSTTDTAAIGLGWGDNTITKEVLVKRTYYGDASLDGQVDVADLGILASNWQTSQIWVGGDFDYNGTVDVNDLGLLASNWQAGVGAPLGPDFATAAASLGLPNVAVPEPAAMAFTAALFGLLRSRRRLVRQRDAQIRQLLS